MHSLYYNCINPLFIHTLTIACKSGVPVYRKIKGSWRKYSKSGVPVYRKIKGSWRRYSKSGVPISRRIKGSW